jgi:phosphatidylinositol alpha 1,6-mannosyltransferase
MRIAIVTETFLPKVDGIANTICRLLEHFDKRGHQSMMFAPRGAPSTYARTPIIQPLSLPCPIYPELKLANPLANLDQYLDEFKPDLIHVVNPFSLGLSGTHYARTHDIPLIASYHTDIPGYTSRYGVPFMADIVWEYFRWIYNQADLNLCPSQHTLNELKAQGFNNLRLWTRGVDVERFAPSHSRQEWRYRLSDGNPKDLLFLYVGRLAAEKRIDWLLPVIKSIPYARLAIVGDGPMREELQTLFRGTPTTFTGYLHGSELAHAYASSDIFVFPSANETFGNVVLEAMASALPVIAPRSGGVTDLVSDGKTGLLFDPDSPEALVKSVQVLSNNPGTFWNMGSKARMEASKRNWNDVLDHLLEDYTETVHQHHHQKVFRISVRQSIHNQISSWLE